MVIFENEIAIFGLKSEVATDVGKMSINIAASTPSWSTLTTERINGKNMYT